MSCVRNQQNDFSERHSGSDVVVMTLRVDVMFVV